MTLEHPILGRALVALGAAILLSLLAACDVCEPSNPEVDAPAQADDAAQWVAGEWSIRLDVELPAELPPIRWFGGECLTWDYLPEFYDCDQGHYFDGVAWTDEQIQLIRHKDLFNSSLAHELLHWALQVRDGDLDQDHAGPEWEQDMDVRLGLCEYLNPGAGCVAPGEQ